MKLWLPLLVAPLLLMGCGSEESAAEPSSAATAKASALAEAPELDAKDPLTLLSAEGKLHLGGTRTDALKQFPKPEIASTISDLPKALHGQANYSAESWQVGGMGFGTILYDDHLCLALHQVEKMTDENFEALLQKHRDENRVTATEIRDRFVHYVFWETDTQRLMICGFRSPEGSWSVTSVLGAKNVMDVLRMSPTAANEDKDVANRTMSDFFDKTGKNLPPKPAPTQTPMPDSTGTPTPT